MKRVLLLTAVALVSASTLVLADAGGDKRGAMIERLKAADTDGNGMLSRQEAAALPRLAERFDAIDANHDGQVTFEELRAFHQAHAGKRGGRSADANGDGKVTREEFMARAASRFDRLDANKDGVLTSDEMAAGHHRHGRGAKQ
jgi:Ca2+-binding EF-hand superfamily protein